MKQGRWPRYPTYRNSGVEWLGEVPGHWEQKRLADCGAWTSGSTPSKDVPEFWNGDVPWVSPKDMKRSAVSDSIDHVTHLALKRTGLSLLYPPAVLVVVRGMILAHTAPVARIIAPLTINQDIRSLQLDASIEDHYLVFLLNGMESQLLSLVDESGHGTKRLPQERLRNFSFFLPPLTEQHAIATFLDHQTARIDNLIAKNERLLELLDEKRTALITQAVTKGIDPTIPIKDSGVKWLGKIPAHWRVMRVKAASIKIGSGKTPSGGAEVYVPEGVMLLRSQNVHFGALRLEDVAFIDAETDAEMASSRVREGDVLLNITGASLGRCCVARLDGRPANVNQHVCVIRPEPLIFEPTFLAAALASRSGQAQIFAIENGISRDALNFDQIGRLVIGCPPLAEQHAIAAHLDHQTAHLDTLRDKITTAITLLREYRTGLISAAVTGKIDVRGFTPAASAAVDGITD